MGRRGKAATASKAAAGAGKEPDQATRKACLQETPEKMKRNNA